MSRFIMNIKNMFKSRLTKSIEARDRLREKVDKEYAEKTVELQACQTRLSQILNREPVTTEIGD